MRCKLLFLVEQRQNAVDDQDDAEDDEEPVIGSPLVDDQQDADERRENID